jgi:uracil permease
MARVTTDLQEAPIAEGYLPTDLPPFLTTFMSGWQVLIAVFPATVLVAILTKFDVGTTLLTSGLSTIIAVLISKRRIPFYYGSSFSYIAAVGAVVASNTNVAQGVRIAQGGIVASGILQIVVGLAVVAVGKQLIDKILPPILTGSVAIVIGMSLSKVALDMAVGEKMFDVALVTLIVTIMASVYLRRVKFWGLFPILIGAVVGYFYAIAFHHGQMPLDIIGKAAILRMPPIMMPAFSWAPILAIAPMALATIPETTAHLYQLSLYVDLEAERQGRPKQGVNKLLGQAVAFVGLSDVINGLFGGPAGTNYGEANATMAITKNYASTAVLAAGIFAVCLGFIGTLAAVIQTIPQAVIGGLSIYLFGVIGKQGIALITSERVDLTDTRNLAIGALVLVIGIGGSFFPGGNLPLAFGDTVYNLPAIATASVTGILLNLFFQYVPGAGGPAAAAPSQAD